MVTVAEALFGYIVCLAQSPDIFFSPILQTVSLTMSGYAQSLAVPLKGLSKGHHFSSLNDFLT